MHWNSRQSQVVSRQSPGAGRKATVGVVALSLCVVSGFSRTLTAQQYTFDEVASGLKHQDAATRLRAIQILKEADYPEAVVPIAAALADGDDRVQLAAIDAERSLFTTRAVARRKRVAFVVEVRSVAGGEAAAAGQLALKARTMPTQVLNGIAVALRDGNVRVRAEAINLAMLLGPVACAPEVRLKPDTTGVRGVPGGVRLQADLDACAQIGNALVDNINSREAPLRRSAMQVLGQLRYPNAVQALSDQLSYRQRGDDAMAALEGLAGIGHPTSVSFFEASLASSDADVRRLGVEGLARAGHRDALNALQQMGQSERSAAVLLAIHYAHVKLDAVETSLQQLLAALGNDSQRPSVLGYLLDLSTSMAPAMAASLKDPSPDVRRLVADVIGFSRNPTMIAALGQASRDVDPDVAAAAQQAIERLKL